MCLKHLRYVFLLVSISQRCFYKSRKSSFLSLKILQLILLLGSVKSPFEPNPSLSVFLSAFINGPHILSLTKKVSMNYALSIGFLFHKLFLVIIYIKASSIFIIKKASKKLCSKILRMTRNCVWIFFSIRIDLQVATLTLLIKDVFGVGHVTPTHMIIFNIILKSHVPTEDY